MHPVANCHLGKVMGGTVLFLALCLPVGAADVVPVMAGKTIIHSDGMGGVRLRVPKRAVLDVMDITLMAENPTFVAMGPALTGGRCGASETSSSHCVHYLLNHIPDDGFSPYSFTPSPPEVGAGLFDIHVVSAGPVILELNPRGLLGVSSVEATAGIDATMERLPARCPQQVGCHRHAFGGATHSVRAPALLVLSVYAVLSSEDDPAGIIASNSVRGCLYPFHDPATSTDPQDYPYGCNNLNESGSLRGVFGNVAGHATYLANAIPGHSLKAQYFYFEANGPQYAGYMAQSYAVPEETGRIGAYGLWLNIGLRCPSGDFTDC